MGRMVTRRAADEQASPSPVEEERYVVKGSTSP